MQDVFRGNKVTPCKDTCYYSNWARFIHDLPKIEIRNVQIVACKKYRCEKIIKTFQVCQGTTTSYYIKQKD